MNVNNKQALKKLTYIGLSLISMELPFQPPAEASFLEDLGSVNKKLSQPNKS